MGREQTMLVSSMPLRWRWPAAYCIGKRVVNRRRAVIIPIILDFVQLHLEYFVQVCYSQHKKDFDILEWIPWRVTKRVWGVVPFKKKNLSEWSYCFYKNLTRACRYAVRNFKAQLELILPKDIKNEFFR